MEDAEQLVYHVYKQYQVMGKIGKGTYGVVYKVKHKKSGKYFAIKKIIDAFQNLIDAKRTYRELNYLFQLDHPNIIRLQSLLSSTKRGIGNLPSTTRMESLGSDSRCCDTDKFSRQSSCNLKHVYAVFQYAEADLGSVLKRCTQMQQIQRKFIAYQLIHGLAYLHRSGLIHRDIKPENILININSLQVKICDFGMARLKTFVSGNQSVLTQYIASRWYRPPQVLLGMATCEPSIDLWGLGCVIAELVLKSPIFVGKSTLDQIQTILRSIGTPTKEQIDGMPSFEAQYVIRNFLFSKRSKCKPIEETLKNCSALQFDLISNLLKFDPKKRLTTEEALKHKYFDEVRQLYEYNESANKFAEIKDLSEERMLPQSESRGLTDTAGIEYYKALVEQLQKFTDKSTNRSGPYQQGKKYENIVNKYQFEDTLEHFKQKSTKESNYISQNKQKYLSKTVNNCSIFKQCQLLIPKEDIVKGKESLLSGIQETKSKFYIKSNDSTEKERKSGVIDKKYLKSAQNQQKPKRKKESFSKISEKTKLKIEVNPILKGKSSISKIKSQTNIKTYEKSKSKQKRLNQTISKKNSESKISLSSHTSSQSKSSKKNQHKKPEQASNSKQVIKGLIKSGAGLVKSGMNRKLFSRAGGDGKKR